MYRHIWAEINLDALRHNINTIAKFVPVEKMMGVVKANAYGHGAGVVSAELYRAGVRNFAVSNVYEALDLRFTGLQGNILLLGGVDPQAVQELAEHNITACVYGTDCAKRLNDAAVAAGVQIKCHLKLDTGMGRLGFNLRHLPVEDTITTELESVFALPALKITGAFTHFAVADRDGDADGRFTAGQYERFTAGCNIIEHIGAAHGVTEFCFHSSNSAATLLDCKDKPSHLYRAGIILYGLTPSDGLALPCKLLPVMSFKATVSFIKDLQTGDSVSYGRTYISDAPRRIATVTAGYADGFMRGLSNKGCVFVRGQKAPILGRVCMDQAMVDVTQIPDVKEGDIAELFGEHQPIEELAKLLGTINYELVCAVAHRVPRVYMQDGKPQKVLRYRSI